VLAEVVTIGDEVCRGEIVDTNSAYLAAGLWDLDVTVGWMSSCRDLESDIADTLRRAASRAELVLVTGGLGPTLDDLTVDVVAGLVGVPAVVDPGAKRRMDERVARARYVAPNMERQVRVPEGAQVYDNAVGLAPCFEVRVDRAQVICLPGPPRELRPIFEDHLVPRITALREARGEAVERIARRIYRVFGRGESQIAAMLEGLCDDVPGASLHFQVKFPECLVKVVVRGGDVELVGSRLEGSDRDLRERLGGHLYGVDDDSLPAVVGAALRRRGWTLASAESCTGGLIGALITDVAGSSEYYLGGAVTYANSEKTRQVGVSEELLAAHGAVSEACVTAMARGIRERSHADVGVAVSGIAGPSGGSAEKPVGTVWIAVSGPDDTVATRELRWPSTREQVRTMSAYAALAMVLRLANGGSK